jgi:hypothetical protein
MHLTLYQSTAHLICHPQKLKQSREHWQKSKKNLVKQEYSIIYADLFRINFRSLRKIKLKGQPKDHSEAITSLEPITLLHAPFLEEFSAGSLFVTQMDTP